MSQLRTHEQDAAGIVKDALGGDRVEQRDVSGGPDGTHGFDVMVGPRRVAVEVKRATDERLMQLHGALQKQCARTGSTKLPAVQAASRWSVWLQRTTRVHRLSSRLDSLLAAAEADGVWFASSFGCGRARAADGQIMRTPTSVRALMTAGVKQAFRWRDVQISPAIDVLRTRHVGLGGTWTRPLGLSKLRSQRT